MHLKVLHSNIDNSINNIEEHLGGFLEARYVRKCDEYFIIYVSSHNGCNLGCLQCHLTVTQQKSFNSSTEADFLSQTKQIIEHYKSQSGPKASLVHINFMARGEIFANKTILESGDDLLYKLGNILKAESLPVKFNLIINPTIYYSLYSASEIWRKKWMPAAMNHLQALEMLREYQKFSKKIIKIHFPFIAGENDSEKDINNMCDSLDKFSLLYEFNLVRYNPATPAQGIESSEDVIKRNMQIISKRCVGKCQIIPKVGIDVYASCGVFY